MIDGCPIRDAFRHVFASKFVYDDHGVAIWPAVGVNYTTKTQYLFRINKGVLNHYEHERINNFIPDDERPIPFDRMIFLGDGDTDVPTMKMMHTKGGFSIAVYDPRNSERDQAKIYSPDLRGPGEFRGRRRLSRSLAAGPDRQGTDRAHRCQRRDHAGRSVGPAAPVPVAPVGGIVRVRASTATPVETERPCDRFRLS